ncbi:hypothetical protein HPB50_020106 [Hyalomma asiaticum]|uniref:Uncharacterized protein n=1 Tax=Hyalomma asiaticum TaxID=266040 RepID=A0ACB7RNF7_HYAAI|nr:hypothetical protein HPB50_020106 [Hyalomma asiaticum]
MANSLEEVDDFVAQGANAVEADLTFGSDGTPEKFYHGWWLCDCGRDCEKSTEATEYLSYLRDGVKKGTIPSKRMLNVILSVFETKDKDILSGALDTLKKAGNSSLFLNHVGFDISGFALLSTIASIYEELGIWQHRWQGDGTSNCLIDVYWDVRTKAAVSRRTAANTTHDYVDKVYLWTVDRPYTMRRFLRLSLVDLVLVPVLKSPAVSILH